MTEEDFKKLNKDKKIDYLESILLPVAIKNHKEREMEIFLYQAKDNELIEFYSAMMNPEKKEKYIQQKETEAQKCLNELKQIQSKFIQAKIKLKESMENENNIEGILDNI